MATERRKRLILLASARSYRNQDFLRAAERLGIEVVTGADVPLPFLPQVKDGLPLDYRDLTRSTDAVVRYAREHPVGAILGVDDSGTLLAAQAAEVLGLPHNAPAAAAAARNKRLMRECFAAASVPQPAFRAWSLGDDPRQVAEQTRFPCVVKPTTLSASRGVMRADDAGQLLERFERLRRILAREGCDEVLIEDYLPGVEVALEGLLDAGTLHPLALFDKPDPLEGPFFEETIYVTPSRLPESSQQAILSASAQAAAALGLREGPVHAELRVNQHGPWLVEVAARSIGGLCARTLRFGASASLEELILRQAFGLGIELPREGGASGVMMIPIPPQGVLRGVHGLEQARTLPLVEAIEITARVGHPLVPLPEGDAYLGFIFARGDTPGAVEAALRAAHAALRFDVAPELTAAQ